MRNGTKAQIEQAIEELENDFSLLPDEVEDGNNFMEEFSPANVTTAKIAELKSKYGALKILGIDDKRGYDIVHAARIEVRDYRLAVDRVRKQLKEESLAWGRKVDGEAKRIASMLTEIEAPLDAEETRIDREIERIKAEKQREIDEKIQSRLNALSAVGGTTTLAEIAMMTDTIFGAVLKTAQEAFEAKEKIRLDQEAAAKAYEEQKAQEAARIAKEEADAITAVKAEQAKEAQRLAAEKAEQDRQAAAFKAERDAFEAEKARVAKEALDRSIREDAEAKAKADALCRAEEDAERDAREEARRKAAQAAQPDAEKLIDLAAYLEKTPWPDMSTDAGRRDLAEIMSASSRFVAFIGAKAKALTEFKV